MNGIIHSDNYNEIPKVIKSGNLRAGNITWMTPCFYQTHKLINEDKYKAAISIQAYSHVQKKDPNHEYVEYFNYVVSGKSDLRRFYPNADFDYFVFKTTVKEEFKSKTCKKTPGDGKFNKIRKLKFGSVIHTRNFKIK